MLKKNKKFVYVVLNDKGVPLYVNKNLKKVYRFVDTYRYMFGISPSYLSNYISITTLDEYNKTISEEKMIDDMYKEYLECQNKIRVNVKLS